MAPTGVSDQWVRHEVAGPLPRGPYGAAGAATYPSSLRVHTGVHDRVHTGDNNGADRKMLRPWLGGYPIVHRARPRLTATVARDASQIMVTAVEDEHSRADW